MGLLSDPIFLMGMGLLGERGQPKGLLTGLQLAQKGQYQNALMNKMQAQQALAQRKDQRVDDQQAALKRLAKASTATPIPGSGPISQNPQSAYALNPIAEDMAVGAPEIMQRIMEAKMIPVPPKVTDDMAEYNQALKQGYEGSFEDWMMGLRKSGATQVINNMPGSKKLDETYAGQLAEFEAGGKFADSEKMLDQLIEAFYALGDKSKNLTGPVIGQMPDSILSFINPEAIANREAVEEVVQRNLKAILGAQFTEREGERLVARAYNPKLSEEENRKRVGRLINQIKSAHEAKKSAAAYFKKNRTLDGWSGPTFTIDDFYTVLDKTPDGLEAGAEEGGYRFKGGNPADPNNWEEI
ncbi:MAG: hypothetical protein AB2792_19885 [Candidatus Thiodiazotropha sp.]